MPLYPHLEGRSDKTFSPTRHTAKSVFGDTRIEAVANGQPFTIYQLNQSILSGHTRSVFAVGDEVKIVITAPGLKNPITLFSDTGTATTVNSDSLGCEFDVEFQGCIDLEKLSAASSKQFKRQILGDDLVGPSEHLPSEYALLSIDLLHHLAGLRKKANMMESAADHTTHSIYNDALRLVSSHGNEFRDLWYKFNDAIADIPYGDDRFTAIKWHTDRVLRPMFMGAPVFSRSYEKPFGYPGDYQVMLYAYDSATPIKTPSLYDAVLQQYFSHGFGACIRSRLDLAVSAILANIRSAVIDDQSRYEILNVGCGAAVELPALIDGSAALNKRVSITLLDQDERPLQFAYTNAAAALYRNKDHCNITAFNMTFMELYKAGRLSDRADLGQQNAVYSLGLLDYFKPERAKRFAETLYERVKPGGVMVLCNVAKTRVGCEWILECLTDWRLIYRTRDDMSALFADLPSSPHVSIQLEDSKQMWVAVVEKPA